jgi:hypothetical protein
MILHTDIATFLLTAPCIRLHLLKTLSLTSSHLLRTRANPEQYFATCHPGLEQVRQISAHHPSSPACTSLHLTPMHVHVHSVGTDCILHCAGVAVYTHMVQLHICHMHLYAFIYASFFPIFADKSPLHIHIYKSVALNDFGLRQVCHKYGHIYVCIQHI